MNSLIVLTSFSALCIIHIQPVSAHAAMVMPYNWFDKKTWIKTEEGYKYERAGMKSGLHCYSGCDIPDKDICPKRPKGCHFLGQPASPGCACMWYKNFTNILEPTIFDHKLLTYPHVKHPEVLTYNPWRAPGTAPVDSPCGVAGGNIDGCFGGVEGECHHAQGGFGFGIKAVDYHFNKKPFETNWTRGDVVEVAFGILANHGGGYSYRICKLPEEGVRSLTEECFQEIPLNFVGTTQWVQYGEDVSTREGFQAIRTSKGTFPKGSQWTKNPVPACNGVNGGAFDKVGGCPHGTQFPPPKPGVCGFGINGDLDVKPFQFSIVDRISIPKDIETGNYILSFRYDAEQTPQVWNTCASIYLS